MKKLVLSLLFIIPAIDLYSQSLLIRIDRPAIVKLDGQNLGQFEADDIKKVPTIGQGEHIVQAVTPDGLYKMEQVVYILDTTQEVFYLKNWKIQPDRVLNFYFEDKFDAYIDSPSGKAFLLNEDGSVRSKYFFITNGNPVEILRPAIKMINGREAVWVKCRHTAGWMLMDEMEFLENG